MPTRLSKHDPVGIIVVFSCAVSGQQPCSKKKARGATPWQGPLFTAQGHKPPRLAPNDAEIPAPTPVPGPLQQAALAPSMGIEPTIF